MGEHFRGQVVRFSAIAGLVLSLLAFGTPARTIGLGSAPGLRPAAPGAVPVDTRIIVNIPAFRMDVFQDGNLIKTYKVAIGYPQFPLPIGQRTADEIIISPTWTPPKEAWVETRKSKVRPGERIPAGSSLNPLGPIKIPIGLPNLIHGGKTPAQIGTFGSHGCVGLTTPQVEDFAKLLVHISGTNVTDQQIAEAEQNKTQTQPIKLSKPIPVELRYETIEVDNGKLDIYRDVYALGTDKPDNVAAALQAYGLSPDQLSPTERQQIMNGLSKMERDARGRPVTKTEAAPKKGTTAYVTRSIIGAKQVVVPVQALTGKGYPAPVNLDTGQVAKAPTPAHRARKR